MQDNFILFWWWEDEEYCCKCVKFEMLVRHLSRDFKQTTRSDHIILLLETLHWLPILVRIKSKVFIMAVKVLFCLLLASLIPFSSFLPLTHCFRHSCPYCLWKLTMSFLPQGLCTHSTFCLKNLFPQNLCLSLIPTPFSSLIKFQFLRTSSPASLLRRVSTFNFNSLSLDPD